jgi:hypothetical protein
VSIPALAISAKAQHIAAASWIPKDEPALIRWSQAPALRRLRDSVELPVG